MSAQRVLLVSPAFHGYHRGISTAVASLGHHVSTHVYDASSGISDKLRTKLLHELPEKMGQDTTAARREVATNAARMAVLETRPEVVLVVKGDVLGDDFWEACTSVGARTVLWLYDELWRTRWDASRLACVGAVASYSSEDMTTLRDSGIEATHVPLGFDTFLTSQSRPRTDEITLIGARYAQREQLLVNLHMAGVPVRAYGRDWSHDLRDRLRTWGTARPAVPTGRDLSRADAYAVMAASAATLNIHGNQDGFTMRTFEASGVGGVQLCDRPDVAHYLEPGVEVLTFNDTEDAAGIYRRLKADLQWADRIREAGRHRVLSEHTLVHRARTLETLWG